ncbi:EAL domain-containing protein [Dechloromonas denitrificans]|uniref:putative bifunctional diguanylate cyclase/phosphodiesterase n=1 Tax=Dechloromonas denitrificans TaxID=281362 RepID=UPI001CF829FD|nr:EAL domain-containing protein [Dechloromonas denitrificans]UCV11056.1 EAL domain-containing protein [Dechloromonas denitrificans]
MNEGLEAGFHKPPPIIRLLLTGMILVSLIVTLTIYETYARRERAFQDSERNLGLLATALAEYTERTFQSIDVLLHNIEADLAQLDLNTPAGVEEATRMLRRRTADFPAVNSLNIVGARGELLASSFAIPSPPPNYSDREYFTDARDGIGENRVRVGRPIFGKKTKRWAIAFTLRRENRRGEFRGTIYAGLDVEKLTDYYRSAIPFEGGAAALYRLDARLLARYPLVPDAFAKDYSDIDLFRQHQPRAANGFYRAISSIDGVPRSVAYRTLPTHGLVINVSANEEIISATWRRSLWLPGTIGVTGLLIILGLLLAILRQRRNQSALHERIAWQASHDASTGLPNRFLFEDRLHKAMQAAERKKQSLALLFIDLDNFKRINDSLGHATGDEVLRTAAIWLRACVRESDTVSRFGGDEFAILLPEVASVEDAGGIAGKILQQFNEPMRFAERDIRVTSSIGISLFPQDGSDPTQLMASADAAMYRAKENGRNLACMYDQDLARHIRERMELEDCLQHALANNEFLLAFQPIMDTRSHRVFAAEALLRWQQPSLGLISPDRFIPLAESTGQIEAIGEWVLREACRQAAQWPESNGHAVALAVNLSPRQLAHPHFVATVKQILDETGIPASRIELEITENLLITPNTTASDNLAALREMGLGLAIDDFGTGYSSLSYLSRLPVTTLKVDRSFVARLENSPQDLALAKAIIMLTEGLGLKTIGEGVETQAQSNTLQQLGCHLQQGYLFAKPLPAGQFIDWLKKRR